MPRPKSSKSLQFIVSLDGKKRDVQSNKLIRSHVMLGKNRGKKQASNSVSPAKDDPPIPRSVGSLARLIGIPDVIDSYSAIEALKYAQVSAMSKHLLEPCLVFDPVNSGLVEYILLDPLTLQTVIFMVQTYYNLVGHRSLTPTQQAIPTALQLLRERLSHGDEELKISEATMFLVVSLAYHAFIAGEYDTAMQHLNGVRKMIDLRGGLATVSYTKLLIDLHRCDIGMSLQTGSKPIFAPAHDASQFLVLETDDMLRHGRADGIFEEFIQVDDDIAKIWQFMMSFCSLVNLGAEAQGRIPWTLFLNIMTTLMYRLLDLRYEDSSIDEAVRLGLLGLSSHILLQWKFIMIRYTQFSHTYRELLDRIEICKDFPTHLKSWLLMIGAVSVFTSDDHVWLGTRLKASTQALGIESWQEMRRLLKSLPWVPFVQNTAGNEFFDSKIVAKP